MKKIILTSVIVLFGLGLFTSCDLTEEQLKEKYGIEQGDTKGGDINHDEVGDEEDDDDEEGNTKSN